jgi:hypothetical protein
MRALNLSRILALGDLFKHFAGRLSCLTQAHSRPAAKPKLSTRNCSIHEPVCIRRRPGITPSGRPDRHSAQLIFAIEEAESGPAVGMGISFGPRSRCQFSQ